MCPSCPRDAILFVVQKSGPKKRINLDEIEDDAGDKEDADEDRSEIGSQADEEDYDAEEDYGDNDYAENYFDPGEEDNDDALGGGGGDEGGGGTSSSPFCYPISYSPLVPYRWL